MDSSIFDKFQKKEKKTELKKNVTFPGEVISRNNTNFLITESSVPGELTIPSHDLFINEYTNCLELLYGIRDKKSEKLHSSGIKTLHDAVRVPELQKRAQEVLNALGSGFDEAKEVLLSRFSSSNRLMFLLLSYYNKEDLLFLDIETKSLFFETSIIQIGAGYFSGDIFHVKQLTILEDAAEYEVLEEFKKLIYNKKAFVTFNGKTFDVPFLAGRYAYYDIDTDLSKHHNFDLLHFSRAAFKGIQESFRLKDIEKGILQIPRGEDIGGEEVEEMYDEFLSTGDPTHLEPILFHNKIDIISLMKITQKICEEWSI